jgi:DNA-binding CsgD family transcriptional regulator/tetratricopeptide (TPR) repeat protein
MLTQRSRELVLQLAAGNPLALLELPAIVETTPEQPHADWVPLTSRLEGAFAVSLLDLPPRTRWLLFVLAFNDRPSVGEALAATAALVEEPPTLSDLTPAEAVRLISIEGTEARFRHPLMRSAMRQAAGTAERHAVHAALADVLADDPDRSVWHQAASAVAPEEPVAAQLEATAAGLRQRHETAVAVTALRRAAELSPAPARKGARLIAAAELALELGRNQEVSELIDEAEPLELETRTRHSVLWLRAVLAESSGTAAVESMTEVAEQLIAEGEPQLAMHALYTAAVRCYMFKVDGDAATMVSRVAKTLGLPDRDPTLAAIHALAAPWDWRSRIADDAVCRTPERIIRACPDAASAMDALHAYGIALTCVSEFRTGIVFQDAAITGLRAQGRLGVLARALGSHSVGRLVLADWELATQAAEECLRLSGYVPGAPFAPTDGERILNMGSALLVLGTIAANRGQHDRAETLVTEAVQVEGAIGSNFCLAHIEAARASLALAAGRSADAFQHLIRIFDPDDIAYHWGTSRSGNVLRDLADAARASGNGQAAVALLEPLPRDGTSEEARGTLAYVDAVLADLDAEERFRHAFATAPASGYFQARTQLSFGMWLRRERRKIEARAYLRSAIDEFEGVRAAPWAERARQELRASGESVRRREPDRRDELSPQEMQIAQLAAEGLTNREIGAQLFLSHRTVGSHLYRIFPKLDVKSRAGLAAVLKRAPPHEPS